jgi:hypothetical protein
MSWPALASACAASVQDLRNQQVAIRDTMLGAEPRNLLICPHVFAMARNSRS